MAPRAVLTSQEPVGISIRNKPGGTGRTGLHLGDQFLVEKTSGLLVQGAVDGHNITLSQHLLQVRDTSAADLLLDLRL
jgi:hypothetical protein